MTAATVAASPTGCSRQDPLSRAANALAVELVSFERVLEHALCAQDGYLTDVELSLYKGGKRLRPMLLMLSARVAQLSAAPPMVPDKTIRAAVALEMLHVATLVHDDIIDDAKTRRGGPSVSAARGRDVALLVGDLQFVQALRCFADAVETEHDMRLVKLVLAVGFRICCGQLEELELTPTEDATELHRRYMRMIDRKTAILFALACECGAVLGGSGRGTAYALSRFGRAFGRVFQMMDDLRDLVEPELRSGKPPAIDLAKGRMSLPLIYVREEKLSSGPLRALFEGESLSAALALQAAQAVASSKAFLRAYAEARGEALRAIRALHELPDSEDRTILEELTYDVVDRGFTDEHVNTTYEDLCDGRT